LKLDYKIDQTKKNPNLRSATGAVRTGIAGTTVSKDAGGVDE
jgi:hypothetical protein